MDGDADVRLALAVPPPLPAPHPPRDLLQNRAGRFGSQEVVIRGALKVEARGRRHGRRTGFCGRVWGRRGTQGARVGGRVGGHGGAEEDSSIALAVLWALVLVVHGC